MSYEYLIGVIDEESVLAECGPMRLVIRAWNRKQPQIKLARRAAEESILIPGTNRPMQATAQPTNPGN